VAPVRPDHRGFTLVEVVLALAALAAIALLATATLRMGFRAWEAGQRRADAQQELRAVVELVGEALGGAFPYRDTTRPGTRRPVLFEGEPEEVRLVTTAPPVVLDAPAAPFHALVLRRESSGELRLAERIVPAEEPFARGAETVLARAVSRFRLEYRDEDGAWQERWDGRAAGGIPTAVRLELTVGAGGQARAVPPVVIALALGKRKP
jgi:prepilin-type N-terminal cleavage/methylation domain-containing protein